MRGRGCLWADLSHLPYIVQKASLCLLLCLDQKLHVAPLITQDSSGLYSSQGHWKEICVNV